MCLKYIQFHVLVTRKKQPISSTCGYPVLLKGAPGVHLWPYLTSTDGDPRSHMDEHKLQPILADTSAGSTMQFKKAYLHHLALVQNLWNSEDLACLTAEIELDLGRFFLLSADDCRLFPR